MVGNSSFLYLIFSTMDPYNSVFYIIFSTEENFKKIPMIGMQKTHFCVPHLFLLDCTYTICGIPSLDVLPSVYDGLLLNKKEKTYIRLLPSLKTLNGHLRPKNWHVIPSL